MEKSAIDRIIETRCNTLEGAQAEVAQLLGIVSKLTQDRDEYFNLLERMPEHMLTARQVNLKMAAMTDTAYNRRRKAERRKDKFKSVLDLLRGKSNKGENIC